jgi:undecaprenyl-diphosphatase
MSIIQAITLGLVQGLGEFLPISSSAHLVLVSWLCGWPDQGLAFDVALHWGTLAALLVYFWRDILRLAKGFWDSLFRSRRNLRQDLYQRLAWLLIVASVPGALAGKLLEDHAERVFRNPVPIAGALGVFALVLLAADYFGRKQKPLDQIRWWDALLIGCSQALAVIPGVSRSGSTIAAGLALGFQRADAARFSFLLSAPIIFGAGLAHLRHWPATIEPGMLLVGFLAAMLSGFLAIRYLLRYLARHDFRIFVWYRLGLAAAILILVWRYGY